MSLRQVAGSRIRLWEVALASVFLLGLSYFALQWGMEGVIHSRQPQVVPDLRGKPIAAALDLLSPLQLALKKEGVEFDQVVPVGAVLRQNPSPGTRVREGKVVRVVVSQGGEAVFIPNAYGLPLRNAERLFRQSQLLLGEVSETYSLRLEKGMVLAQDPKAESSVEKNSFVNVVVSGGSPPSGIVLMPDFRQRTVSQVNSWASGSGVVVSIQEDPNSLFPHGTVLTQKPTPDSAITDAVRVEVVVSGRPKDLTGASAAKNLHYEVSQGSSDSMVRIVVVDSYGEREVFHGLRQPGSKIDLAIPESAGARVKIFLNGILVEEREL